MRLLLKILLYTLLALIIIVVGLIIALRSHGFQNKLVKEATEWFSQKTNTTLTVDRIEIDFFTNLNLRGVLLTETSGDTIARVDLLQIDALDLLKDERVIKDVNLKGVYAYIHREAEQGSYNIDKIIDSLSSDKPKKEKKERAPLSLDLKQIRLQDIEAQIIDDWKGQDMVLILTKADVLVDSLDIESSRFLLDHAELTSPSFLLRYKSPSPKYSATPPKSAPDTSKPKPHLELANLDLRDGAFRLYRVGSVPPSSMKFDPNDIDLKSINLQANDVHTADNAIIGAVKRLSAKDKSGIGIENMRTQLTMSTAETSFEDMSLQLNESLLSGAINFDYRTMRNLSYFLDSVRIDAQLSNSQIATNDIAYFTNELAPWNINADASLIFEGAISDFKASVNQLRTERGSQFQGTIAMKGLPDIDRTLMDIKVDKAVTNLNALSQISPELKEVDAVNFDVLGDVAFVGSFVGRYLDFEVQGVASTRNGAIQIKRFLYDMLREGEPKYSGSVAFQNLNIEGFIPDLPRIEGKGDVDFEATGIDPATLYIDINSNLKSVIYDGIAYDNIQLDGRATGNGVKAKVKSAGDKIYGDFDLLFDMTDAYNLVLDGDFTKVDLKAMGLSEEVLVLKGLVDADLSGDFTKVINGYARLSDATVQYKDSVVREDFIKLETNSENDQAKYVFTTPTLSTSLQGKFYLDQLPGMIESTIYRYLPAYIDPGSFVFGTNNYADLTMEGGGFQKYFDLFIPDLKLSDDIWLHALIGYDTLDVKGELPYLKYGDYLFDSLVLNFEGDQNTLVNMLLADEFYNQDAKLFNTLNLQTNIADNAINLRLETTDNYQNQNLLQSNLLAINDTFKFHLLPSDIFVNDRKWHLQSDGVSFLHDRYLQVANTDIDNGLGKFVVKSVDQPGSPYPSVLVKLLDFDLKNVLDFLDTDLPDINSIASGKLLVDDPMGDFSLTNNLTLSDFTIEGQPLGDVNLDATYSGVSQRLDLLNSSGITYGDTYIKLAGDVLLDSTQKLNVDLVASEYDISPFEAFINDYITGLEGQLNGTLNVGGTLEEYDVTGDMNLAQTKFTVPVMGNTYRMPETHLNFNNYLFETDTTLLYDEDNNIAKLYGLIGHNNFNKYNFSIDFWSDKFRTLNTTAEDNDQVYGNVVARLNALIFGSLEDLVFGLSIEPVQFSEITAVNVEGDKGGGLDGIDFRGIGDFADTSDAEEDNSRVKLELSAKVSPLLKANYIISQVDNSSITARADGDITINYNLGKGADEIPLTAYGGFEITDGKINYLNSNNFELSQIAGVKIFDIKPGSKVVINGDPMLARITGGANTSIEVSGLEGMFTAEELDEINRTSPAAKNDIYKSQDVQVGVELRDATVEDLQNIEYKISLPEVTNNNSEVGVRLAAINSDQNEASKQVMSLLILNSFLSEDNMSTRMVLNSAIGNTANIFTSRISSSLNQTIKNVTNLDNLDVGLGLKFENDSSSLLNEQSLIPVFNFNGRMRFLDNRLILKVGYDINMANYSSSSVYGTDRVITGDYKLEYKLDRGQDFDAYVYRNSSYDPLLSSKGKINRSGIGLSYTLSFENINDIFARKEEEEKMENNEQ